MYSASVLSGTESSSFWSYWDLIRNRMGELIAVGPRIQDLWQEAKDVRARTNDPKIKAKLEDQIYRLSSMYITWQGVKEHVDEWADEWRMIAASDGSQSVPPGAMTLSFVPLVLPAWAIATLAAGGLAALTYVATHGLDLLKQYQSEQAILAELKADNPNVDALLTMHGQLQVQPGGFLNTFGSSVGSALGTMIPAMLGIGALVILGPKLFSKRK